MRRSLVALAALGAALAGAADARAQEFPIAATFDAHTGIEGGGKGLAHGVRRARTFLRFGGEMALADFPGPRIGAGLLVELEPHASLGADVRYIHLFGNRFALNLGAVGIFAPGMLFGATAGGDVRIPVNHRFTLTLGPVLRGFFFGGDLPEGTVIWQALFKVGVHVSLR